MSTCWHGSISEDKRTACGLEHRDGCRQVPHVGRARLVKTKGLRDESPRSNLGRMSQGGAARVDKGAREQLGRRQTTTSNSRREVRAQVKVSVNKKDSLRTIFEHFSRSACQQWLKHEFCSKCCLVDNFF